MKARKNTNAESIKQFIALKNPTRKEIVRFIAITLNGCPQEDFNYKTTHRGYYSTFFRDCKHFGTIASKDKKYYITESCLSEGNGLWSMTKDRRIELLQSKITRMNDQHSEIMEQSHQIHTLKAELQRVSKIRRILEEENDHLRADCTYLSDSVRAKANTIKRYYDASVEGKKIKEEQFKVIENLRAQKKVLFDEALKGNESNEEKYNEIIIKIKLAITK